MPRLANPFISSEREALHRLNEIKRSVEPLFHRRLVVLSGDKDSSQRLLEHFLKQESIEGILTISCESMPFPGRQLEPGQVFSRLGTEAQILVWNGFDGIHPDAFGAVSGALRGGGLMLLLLPDLTLFSRQPDPDYLRMCRTDDELKQFGTRFLERFSNILVQHPGCEIISLAKIDTDLDPATPYVTANEHEASDYDTASSPPRLSNVTLTEDQISTIKAIQRVALGHNHRPLVIKADRGRGKSSALGIAAARLACEHGKQVVITGPSKAACKIAGTHFSEEIERLIGQSSQKPEFELEYIPPDALLETKPSVDLLLIDEAAALPNPQLKALMAICSRIVLATTIHGYEGTGRGFTLRFEPYLIDHYPGTRFEALQQPVRWASNDPLEALIFRLLCLDCDLPAKTGTFVDTAGAQQTVEWVSREQLLEQTGLLEQVVGLLTLAHYQTRPADVRMILDHPALTLGISRSDQSLTGAILLLREGGNTDPSLANGLIQGRRRPRGDLIPQSLTAFSGQTCWLGWTCCRIMRIAVHPQLARCGIGTALLKAARQKARQAGIDYIASSFGLSPSLGKFWAANGFTLVKLGYHRDAASSEFSAIVASSLDDTVTEHVERLRKKFTVLFLHLLPDTYETLNWRTICFIVVQLPAECFRQPDADDLALVEAFALHHRSFEDSAASLFSFLLQKIQTDQIRHIDEPARYVCIARILQGQNFKEISRAGSYDFAGKKAVEQCCRSGIAALLELGSELIEKTS